MDLKAMNNGFRILYFKSCKQEETFLVPVLWLRQQKKLWKLLFLRCALALRLPANGSEMEL